MKARDLLRAAQLDSMLAAYSGQQHALPGISVPDARRVFLCQLIDSLHRVEYPGRLLQRDVSPRRADPSEVEFFDPIRAAVSHARQGDHDEACWLIFLFVAYGKGKRTGWRLIRDVYGRLGQGGRWDWVAALADPAAMATWITGHEQLLWPKGTSRPFGAHRQHETIVPTGRTLQTYITWIGNAGHIGKFGATAAANGGVRRRTFDVLYQEMDCVYRFGRLGKFDYLTMLGKLELAPLEPGSTYMTGATGPVKGARLLFAGNAQSNMTTRWLDAQLVELDAHIGVGMQVLEDALCNWQKSPTRFKAFRG